MPPGVFPWRSQAKAFKKGSSLKPRRKTIELSRGISIILGPGRAFGSGEHETTLSVLEMLQQLPSIAGAKVLDLGAGTGILAIAAAKLGAGEVIAVDIDPDAVEATRRNARLNGVQDKVTCMLGDLKQVPEGGFDLILANLYGDILLALAPELAEKLKPRGHMILSGILYQDHFEVKNRLIRLGLRLIRSRMGEEYCTVWWRR